MRGADLRANALTRLKGHKTKLATELHPSPAGGMMAAPRRWPPPRPMPRPLPPVLITSALLLALLAPLALADEAVRA